MNVTQHQLDLVMRRVTRDDDGCWRYHPPQSSRGRPRVTVGGRNVEAYKVTWAAFTRETVPEGMMLLHSCDNGDDGCVNPAHLRIGTPSENNADALERGRNRNQNTGKTECKRGHDLTDERNVRYRKDGRRECRECERSRKEAREAADRPA